MKDGEPDFSKYTGEQIERSLRNIDREKYPLNYARLLAAQQALPPPLEQAEVDARHEAQLSQRIARGEVWLSVAWTLLANTLIAAAFAVGTVLLAWRFIADPAKVWNFGELKSWPPVARQAFGLLVIGFFAMSAWTFHRLRRVVMRGGQLEARSLFTRVPIELQDIERVRWNDAQGRFERTQAIIELRVDSSLGRRLRFMPRSLESMRAFAAHVAAVQGRAVADPAYRSYFFVRAAGR